MSRRDCAGLLPTERVPGECLVVSYDEFVMAATAAVIAPNAQRHRGAQSRLGEEDRSQEGLAAYVDRSMYDLSGIVVPATFEKTRILLAATCATTTSLRATGREGPDGTLMPVDLLKVSHHGS